MHDIRVDLVDDSILSDGEVNRRNVMIAGSVLATASLLSSTPGLSDQAGASGAHSNSAITMQPPTTEVFASRQERVLAAKIARAMLSGP